MDADEERLRRLGLDDLIREMLADDDDTRYLAARTLAKHGKPAVDAAVALTRSQSALARDMACFVLGQVSDPTQASYVKLTDGIPTLLRVLETDPDDEVRGSAACAIGHHSAVEATPLLCELVVSRSSTARYHAAWALGCFGDWSWETMPHYKPLAEGALLQLTHDPGEDVRDWSVFGLHQGDHDTPAVRKRMWETLDDDCPEVRGESAAGLAKFGDRSFIPRLRTLLIHDTMSPLYFEAAEEFADSSLLPVVLLCEQRWRADLEEGETMHSMVTSAVTTLRRIAASQAVGLRLTVDRLRSLRRHGPIHKV